MAKVNQRLRDFSLSFPHHVEKTLKVTDNQLINILHPFLHNVENDYRVWKTQLKGPNRSKSLSCSVRKNKRTVA